MQYIVSLGIEHLLVDMPSVDRAFDEVELNIHYIFWQVNEGTFDLNEQSNLHNTITEMVYIKDAIKDGNYMLNLQITPFTPDASPSRPLLFEITES